MSSVCRGPSNALSSSLCCRSHPILSFVMIPVRQAQLSTPSSRYPSRTSKTALGLPVVLLGLLLPLGLVGNAALGSCVCDEYILGKEYCDQLLAMCRGYSEALNTVREKAKNYGWTVCNKSSKTAYAAYASAYEGYGYTRKGWYTINPRSCQKLITESMRDKNYYISILNSNENTLTRQEKQLCMWPPQSNGKIYKANYKTCRGWDVGNKSFEKMEKGNGFITTIP